MPRIQDGGGDGREIVAVTKPSFVATSQVEPNEDGGWWCRAARGIDGFPGWFVSGRFRSAHGVTQLREVRVFPMGAAAGGEPTAAMLRSVKLGDLHRDAYRTLLSESGRRHMPAGMTAEFRDRVRPGRRGWSDAALAALAARYVDALTSHDPITTVAEAEYLSAARVRDLIYLARKRGLLTATTPGRAGGVLTCRARQLLDEEA